MPETAYGTYRDKQIFLDAPVPNIEKSRVMVVFLEQESKRNHLCDMFDILGAWEDDRDADTMVEEIYNARTLNQDIQL